MVFDPQPRGTRGMGGGWGRRRLTTETKHALKTTEFWVFAAVITALMIASYLIDDESGGGTGDEGGDIFRADEAWRLATFLTIGYLISRGLAKAGSREPYWEEPDRGDDGQSRGGAMAGSRQTVGARQSADDY